MGALGTDRVTPEGPFSVGLNYEAAAFDRRDVNDPKFYATVDEGDGPIVRFTPDPAAVQRANDSGDYTNLLTARGNYKHEFAILEYTSDNEGTFTWTESYTAGAQNARTYFPSCEGIGERLFVARKTAPDHALFIVSHRSVFLPLPIPNPPDCSI